MFGSRKQEQLAAEHADITSLQSRLAADLNNLDAGEDPVGRQALVDAAERYNSAGGLLASARSVAELQVARRVVVEGLAAARIVRERQGLPLGPDLPATGNPTVEEPTPVMHDGDQHIAFPDYHPERPHYFGGGVVDGTSAPAGYYRTPFWQKALAVGGALAAGEMLGGALGGILGGGLSGGGYGGDADDWGGAGW